MPESSTSKMTGPKFLKNMSKGLRVNPIVKISIVLVLGLVLFLDNPYKILAFSFAILTLSVINRRILKRSRLVFLFLLFLMLGVVLYTVVSESDRNYAFVLMIRFGLFMMLGYVAGQWLSDRELWFLGGKRLAPVLVGFLVGIQRVGEINENIYHAQIIRGLVPTWSFRRLYLLLHSRGLVLLANLTRLAEVVSYQYEIRGYWTRSLSWRTYIMFGILDCVVLAVAASLLLFAILPL